VRNVCRNAVDAAVGAGASYADARAVFRRSQSVATKNGNVEAVNDVESEGLGVRVLVGGAWGFAADRRLTEGRDIPRSPAAEDQRGILKPLAARYGGMKADVRRAQGVGASSSNRSNSHQGSSLDEATFRNILDPDGPEVRRRAVASQTRNKGTA